MPADRRIAARMGLGALSGYAWAMLSARALTRGFGHLTSVARQVAELIRSGAVVTVIEPDAAAVKAIGRNVLDPARRPAAALAGRAQSAEAAHPASVAWQSA
jgi:NTE family protein